MTHHVMILIQWQLLPLIEGKDIKILKQKISKMVKVKVYRNEATSSSFIVLSYTIFIVGNSLAELAVT